MTDINPRPLQDYSLEELRRKLEQTILTLTPEELDLLTVFVKNLKKDRRQNGQKGGTV